MGVTTHYKLLLSESVSRL